MPAQEGCGCEFDRPLSVDVLWTTPTALNTLSALTRLTQLRVGYLQDMLCCTSAAVPGDSGWRGPTVGAGALWHVPVG